MEKSKILSKVEDIVKRYLPQEEAEVAISILSKAKDDEFEDADGFSVVDNPDEEFEDDADKWLAENDPAKGAKKEEDKPASKYTKNWEAPKELTPEQKAAVEKMLSQGYSEREAHREAGSHKEHTDLGQAMKSGLSPSMMSDKRINELKSLAKLWLDNADRHEKLNADAEKNPMKYAAGQMLRAHENFSGDYHKAYQDMLQSDDVKNLSGKARHDKVKEWKAKWKEANPDYHEKMEEASASQKVLGETRQAAKQGLKDKMEHIMRGGVSMPSEMSAQEAAQHVGGEKGEQGYVANIAEDPSAAFARQNPKLVSALSDEMKQRKTRVDSAARAQGIIRKKGGEQ
jgi:hypothetical protein